MPRMFIAVPSAPTETNHTVVYFGNGTMLDMGQDARCGTCKWWRSGGYEHPAHMCYFGKNSDDENFGCTRWEARDE